MRILLGLAILIALVDGSLSFLHYFSEDGYLPLSITPRESFSVLYLSDDPVFVSIVFILSIIAALLFTAGFQTKITGIVTWVLVVSLHNRNTHIVAGGDGVIEVILFWIMFLPVGDRYSYDALRRDDADLPLGENGYFSLYNFGLFLQIFTIYFVTAAVKNSPEWNAERSAVFYSFKLEYITRPLAQSLLAYPDLMKALTFLTIQIERLAPFFLLIPNNTFRVFAIVTLMLFHIATGILFTVGVFPFACCAALAGLLPSSAIDGLRLPEKLIAPLASRLHRLVSGVPRFPDIISLYDRVSKPLRFAKVVLFSSSLLYLVLFCLARMQFIPPAVIRGPVGKFATITNLKQDWRMFAPAPSKNDYWFIIAGETQNGNKIDLHDFDCLRTYDKDYLTHRGRQDHRWTLYMRSLQSKPDERHHAFSTSLKKRWDKLHPDDTIRSVTIINFMEPTTTCEVDPVYEEVLYSRVF